MSLTRGVVFSLWLGCALTARAAAPVAPSRLPDLDEHWTFEKAAHRALEANPDYLATKFEYERQQGVHMQARAPLLPQLSLSASSDTRAQGLIDFSQTPNERAFVANGSYTARVELRQTLFDGFDTWNQLKKYKAGEEESRLLVESAAHRTVALVRQAYDAVLWRRDALTKEQDRVTALRQVADWTEKKQAAGEVAEFEKFRAQAELKLAESQLAQALSNVAKAEQYFRRLLMIPDGLAAGSALILEGQLEPRTLPWTLSEAIAMAHARRSDLAAAAANLKGAQHSLRAAYGGYFPRIEAYVSYGTQSSYYDASRRLDGWSGGAAARWNIFDGLQTQGRIRTELAAKRASETHLEDIELQIDSQLRELYAGVELSRSALESQRLAADLAGRSLAQARRLLELGQISLEQILQAELSKRQAELGLLEAIYNHNANVAQIEFSIGSDLPQRTTASSRP